MCGRYSIIEFDDLGERFNLDIHDLDLTPRYNVAPSQDVPVILNNGKPQLALLRWGLIPFWAKDPAMGNKMINARAETVAEKPSFRLPLQRRRCLVLADGFYEWQKQGKVKQPYRITLKDQTLFTFAGLWDTWKSPTGQIINSCTILTTTPNSLMQPLHDRMPVILPRTAESVWLANDTTRGLDFYQALLQPYPAELMQAYQVSSLINSPRNDVPECALPKTSLF